jgi:nitrate/nitrite transport system permease protein
MIRRIDFATMVLPLLGIGVMLLIWTMLSTTVARDLPSPMKTWEESKQYILNPFFKDGEMNQGIGRFAFLSLIRVAKGFLLAIVIGTPLGFLLGLLFSIEPLIR